MAVVVPLRSIPGLPEPQVADEAADQLAISGIVRSSSGTGSVYTDDNVTTIAIGGGTAQGVITIGRTGVGNQIDGWVNVDGATAATANGDFAAGDGTNELDWDAATATLALTDGTDTSSRTPTGITATADFDINPTGDPLLKGGVVSYALGTALSVDLTAGASTSLFTVPAGKQAVVTGVIVHCRTANTVSAPPEIGVGSNVNVDDVITQQPLTGLNVVDEAYQLLPNGLFTVAAAASTLSFEVDTAATATALTADVTLLGYLI